MRAECKIKSRPEKEGTFAGAIITFTFCMFVIIFCIVYWKLNAHVPLIIASAIGIIYGLYLNIPLKDLESAMFKSISESANAMVIILIIGALIASWMASGTVPYIIYLGLNFIEPGWFLVFTVIMCSIISTITGSSWTTIGTIGVACVGMSPGMGIPIPVTAGAVVCGAYFGDKCSPVSDITIFVSGINKVDLYEHCKSVFYCTFPPLIISTVLFAVMGFKYQNGVVDAEAVCSMQEGLEGLFTFGPVMWLPLLVLVGLIVLKVPAVSSLTCSAMTAILIAVFYQNMNAPEALRILYYGYSVNSSNQIISSIVSRGGMSSMMYTVTLMMCSLAMAGILGRCHILTAISDKMKLITANRPSLVFTTLVYGIILSFFTADPYIASLIPSKTFEEKYEKLKIKRSVLSQVVTGSGIAIAPMVAWGSNGVFCAQTMGVSTFEYVPYYFLGFLVIPFSFLIAAFSAEK